MRQKEERLIQSRRTSQAGTNRPWHDRKLPGIFSRGNLLFHWTMSVASHLQLWLVCLDEKITDIEGNCTLFASHQILSLISSLIEIDGNAKTSTISLSLLPCVRAHADSSVLFIHMQWCNCASSFLPFLFVKIYTFVPPTTNTWSPSIVCNCKAN